MSETRRRAYLEAMGFDVWIARPPDPEPERLVIGAGAGSTLLVCALPEDSATKLAGDITRALGDEPVWAWPDPQDRPDNPSLPDAVEKQLFTQVIIFGNDLTGRLLGGRIPEVLGSSAVAVCSDLDELAGRAPAKKALWQVLTKRGAVGATGQPN